jgi:hypothetical protein
VRESSSSLVPPKKQTNGSPARCHPDLNAKMYWITPYPILSAFSERIVGPSYFFSLWFLGFSVISSERSLVRRRENRNRRHNIKGSMHSNRVLIPPHRIAFHLRTIQNT